MTHVLLSYPGRIPSVLLCGELQLSHLAEKEEFLLRSVPRDMLTAEDCGWADVVFLVRSDSVIESNLVQRWKAAGKKVVYVLDDDLLNVPPEIASYDYYIQASVRYNIQSMIHQCDVFLSPSEVLRKKYGGEKAATIEEPVTFFHEKNYEFADTVRVGFAGSIDRGHDLDNLLEGVLERIQDRFGADISLTFFGARPELAQKNEITWIPYCDSYEQYQQTMAYLDWDIGLAPMPETPFHNGKHYNKFIEYAGYGIAGIYSNTLPYTRIVSNSENGLLCENTPDAWVNAISRLVEDKALRIRISRNAQAQAKADLSVEATAVALKQALGGLLGYKAPNHTPIRIPTGAKIKDLMRRGWALLCCHRWRTPIVVFQKLSQKLLRRIPSGK